MPCPKCGNVMELLPDLYHHSGKCWYGCKKCNIVIEHNFCSLVGRDMGTTPCHHSYEEYMGLVEMKKTEKKKDGEDKIKKRTMYLVTYEKGALGKALTGLSDLGITREIRCYPNGQMTLFEDELNGLRNLGIKEEKTEEV